MLKEGEDQTSVLETVEPHKILQRQIAEDAQDPLEIVGTEILENFGSYQRVIRWYKGYHCDLGCLLQNGLQGRETVGECDAIKPLNTVLVVPKPPRF